MKVMGVIGGMGPEATANIFQKVVKATSAKKDQEHYKIIVYNDPAIPDRTDAIMGRGPSPVSSILEVGNILGELGVTIACIPCITAHYYIDTIQRSLPFIVINALAETEKYLNKQHPAVNKVGVLATEGTVTTKIFDRYLPSKEIIYPDRKHQSKVVDAIYGVRGIKSGDTGEHPRKLLVEAGSYLVNLGAQILIAGCTEIPLVIEPTCFPVPIIDPMDVVVSILVKEE